ncbi:hypothetical protein [Fredinandcohnia sp. 179-A 10B2 NHS]|uniref:hypothetical protein n=1 Tax=Fredinandcohnia sp. 179-A 10B2 NHS TaxID=3235176 RepID=UPI0039A117E1
MNINFNRFFWGFIILLLDVRIVFIDVFPDPVGYYLIYSGIRGVLTEGCPAKKVKILAMALTTLSIPIVFYQQDIGLNEMSQIQGISPWFIYTITIEILHLTLMFFIFKLIVKVAISFCDEALIKRSTGTFTVYISFMLIFTFANTFLINLPSDLTLGILLFTLPVRIVLEIVFLVLLRKLHTYKGPHAIL